MESAHEPAFSGLTPHQESVIADILSDSKPTVELVDTTLPVDRFILEGIEMGDDPLFSIGEIAKFFFARSTYWVRWNEERGFFTLDGKAVGTQRTTVPLATHGQRRYTLVDVEKMAHALAEKGALPMVSLRQTLHLVEASARLWGYID